MDELESQVAKIQIGNAKQSNSYVYVLTELVGANTELFVVCELPLFNPAAEESCEKICLAIGGTLKRSFRRSSGAEGFEAAVAQINDELGKLASLGQAHWIEKLNCIVAAKEGQNFHIATAGKIAAYLYRAQEFTDISCSAAKTHPLKAFDNVASGKLRLQDLLVLSTTQLFNHLSMDRLKNILEDYSFPAAAQAIIGILKENAGPEVAFGTLLICQVPVGAADQTGVDLENFTLEQAAQKHRLSLAGVWNFITTTFMFKKGRRDHTTELPHIAVPASSPDEKLRRFSDTPQRLVSGGSQAWRLAKTLPSTTWNFLKGQRSRWSLQNFSAQSRQKKFFIVSIIVLLLAFVLNLGLTAYFSQRKANQTQINEKLKAAQDDVAKAQSALLYKDNAGARSFLAMAVKDLPAQNTLAKKDRPALSDLQKQIDGLKQKMDNVVQPQVSNLGNLANGDKLIKLPQYLAVQVGGNIVSFDKNSHLIQDGTLRSSEKIIDSVWIKGSVAVVYNGSALLVWNYGQTFYGPAFTLSVPGAQDFVGLKLYPVNSRVYTINKSAGQILSFAVGDKELSKPVVAARNDTLGNSMDLAIDGSVYVLNNNGVNKYLSGRLQDFNLQQLFTPFSGKGKIATEYGWKNLYILDTGTNRILIFDKKGNVVETLSSSQFSRLKDFQVDEPNKTIYLLNDTSLLKISF